MSCDQTQSAGSLAGQVAVVTGASSGVGRAIALKLARCGAHLCALGRNPATLGTLVAAAHGFSTVKEFPIDLTIENEVTPIVRYLEDEVGRLDILVHSAGIIYEGSMECARIEDFDRQYETNVRAPYRLSQRLLPLLTAAGGQMVFINSSVGLSARRADLGQYAATKHALKAIADSLREEVNAKGVRVLSVYLGRTATPMQEVLYRQQRASYCPDMLLQPEDVATIIIQTLLLPRTAEVTDISIRPMRKR